MAQAELQTYIDKIKAEGATREVFAKYALERSDCGCGVIQMMM